MFNANIYLECLFVFAHWILSYGNLRLNMNVLVRPFICTRCTRSSSRKKIQRKKKQLKQKNNKNRKYCVKNDATGFIWMTIKTCWEFLLLNVCVCAVQLESDDWWPRHWAATWMNVRESIDVPHSFVAVFISYLVMWMLCVGCAIFVVVLFTSFTFYRCNDDASLCNDKQQTSNPHKRKNPTI